MSDEDLLDRLIDRIAEAVVQKMEERRKIDLIAEAVLARLEEQGLVEKEIPAEGLGPKTAKQKPRRSRKEPSPPEESPGGGD